MDIEIIQPVIRPSTRGTYRRHTDEFKRAIVAQSLRGDSSVSRVAREHNANANQVFDWRKQFGDSRKGAWLPMPALSCRWRWPQRRPRQHVAAKRQRHSPAPSDLPAYSTQGGHPHGKLATRLVYVERTVKKVDQVPALLTSIPFCFSRIDWTCLVAVSIKSNASSFLN